MTITQGAVIHWICLSSSTGRFCCTVSFKVTFLAEFIWKQLTEMATSVLFPWHSKNRDTAHLGFDKNWSKSHWHD